MVTDKMLWLAQKFPSVDHMATFVYVAQTLKELRMVPLVFQPLNFLMKL